MSCRWLMVLSLVLMMAAPAQARDLMLTSQTTHDSYYVDLDETQSAPDFGYRAGILYRFTSPAVAKTEGYDYTQLIMGFNCQKTGEVTLVQVIAFGANGTQLREEHADRELLKMDWFTAPEGTHMGQAWMAVCKNLRSPVRPGNVPPTDVLKQVRQQQATKAARP